MEVPLVDGSTIATRPFGSTPRLPPPWMERRRTRRDSGGARTRGFGSLAAGFVLSRPLTARLSADRLVAFIAHECGHAVTRMRDFHVRDNGLFAEWARESCADRLAFRWGFEREIRADAPTRALGHHGALPGQVVWVRDKAFRLDRHFIIRPYPQLDGQAPAVAGLP
jgi:hypothetical protein